LPICWVVVARFSGRAQLRSLPPFARPGTRGFAITKCFTCGSSRSSKGRRRSVVFFLAARLRWRERPFSPFQKLAYTPLDAVVSLTDLMPLRNISSGKRRSRSCPSGDLLCLRSLSSSLGEDASPSRRSDEPSYILIVSVSIQGIPSLFLLISPLLLNGW